jgi:hypothetical protein
LVTISNGGSFLSSGFPNWVLYCRLSANRSAGVISFDSTAIVRIHLDESSTSEFINKVTAMPYRGGGTDIQRALTAALAEINAYKVHPLTLVCEYLSYRTPTDKKTGGGGIT